MKNALIFLISVFMPVINIIYAQKNLAFTSQTDVNPHNYTMLSSDSIINAIVSQINPDSIRYNIQVLQDFKTRILFAPNRFQIYDWIESRFRSFGFDDIERDSFMCHTSQYLNTPDTITLQMNVVANMTGTEQSDEIYIIGGHMDSYVRYTGMISAPGADDNGSGTSAVLEIARVIAASGWQPKATIKFITFAAEELMLFGDGGSEHYAKTASFEGMDIKLMLNCDQICYTSRPVEESIVKINHYTGCSSVRDLAINIVEHFSILTPAIGYLNMVCDSYPFWEEGYQTVTFMADEFSPYYHSPGDTLGYYNMEFCKEITKAAGATLLKAIFLGPLSTNEDKISVPLSFELYQNYPNPFNPVTTISWKMPSGSVSVKVYNVLGSEIITLVNEYKVAGIHKVEFNSSNLPGGVYFYSLRTDSYSETKKMILLK